MSKRYDNYSKVDCERVAEGVVDRGGGVSSYNKGSYTHNTAHLDDEKWRFSWDEDRDGNVSNVHSTGKDGKGYQYSGKK